MVKTKKREVDGEQPTHGDQKLQKKKEKKVRIRCKWDFKCAHKCEQIPLKHCYGRNGVLLIK